MEFDLKIINRVSIFHDFLELFIINRGQGFKVRAEQPGTGRRRAVHGPVHGVNSGM